MYKTLIIIGASGHGKVCLDIAKQMNRWQNIYFLDNDKNIKECLGHRVIGVTADAEKYKAQAEFFVAIGDNNTREKTQNKLEKKNYQVTTLIHPKAIINSHVEINQGTVVMAGVVINSDTSIGRGCIINTSSSVDHDNQIGDYVHISPGVNIAGTVEIGDRTWIGTGSQIINDIKISKNVFIGAGSLVIRNLELPGKYIGIPIK